MTGGHSCCHGGAPDSGMHRHDSTRLDGQHAEEQEEDRQEREAFERVMRAFRAYEIKVGWEVDRWQRNFDRLSPAQRELLPGYPAKIRRARSCIAANQDVIRQMLEAFTMGPPQQHHQQQIFDAAVSLPATAAASGASSRVRDVSGVSSADIDKVSYVLKNIMRDWSTEGATERDASYRPIIEQLVSHFPQVSAAAAAAAIAGRHSAAHADQVVLPLGPRVLIPGAGLGRLCLDIAAAGFQAEGNEHSWYMLVASNFLLNCTSRREQLTVHPWSANSNNQRSLDMQFRAVTFPDRLAADAPIQEGSLAMTAGDFLEVYGAPSMAQQFDAVVTCFFIDTAHVITDYLEVIHRVLVDGGVWINLGPLLWHWSDSHLYLSSDEVSIEVSLEEVLQISSGLGFKLLQQQSLASPYTCDKHSMMSTGYICEFWTMQKTGRC